MAIGTYGIVRPSDVSIDDIDIFYSYMPNRETAPNTMLRINASDVLTYNYLPEDEQASGDENLLEGSYNLRLPASVFNQLGIYNIFIKPKVFPIQIIDCSVLSSLPNVKGIVLNANDLAEKLKANNALQGYKIEYRNDDGTKLRNVVRYCVTANKVVPISQNIGNTSQNTIRYRFDDSGTLMFLQLTPSSSSDVKPNIQPFIGIPGQIIYMSNTNFSPLMVEVDLVENTIDTLADIVAGEQIKDVDNGILTYFDKDRVVTNQFNLYEIKDDLNDQPLFEVKEKRTEIDESQNFDEITDELQ